MLDTVTMVHRMGASCDDEAMRVLRRLPAIEQSTVVNTNVIDAETDHTQYLNNISYIFKDELHHQPAPPASEEHDRASGT
jgi:predicted GTPase